MTKSRGKKEKRPGEGVMPDALAHFLTWTTYGTWLPGDERGWVFKGRGFQQPQPQLIKWCEKQLVEPVCYLDFEQRALIEQTCRQALQDPELEASRRQCPYSSRTCGDHFKS